MQMRKKTKRKKTEWMHGGKRRHIWGSSISVHGSRLTLGICAPRRPCVFHCCYRAEQTATVLQEMKKCLILGLNQLWYHDHASTGAQFGTQPPPGERCGCSQRKTKAGKVCGKYEGKRLHFITIAITTFGAFGPQATQFIDDAADLYSAKCAADRGLCRKQLVERVQVALLHEVGKRLLAGIQADEGKGGWMSRSGYSLDVLRSEPQLALVTGLPD